MCSPICAMLFSTTFLKQHRNLCALHSRLCHVTPKIDDRKIKNNEDRHITDTAVDPCKSEPAVVIIGAGIAGLSAAQRLSQSGISNFTVLEATDRPGGRIHSCWLGDVIVEMGAQYTEGSYNKNPVYNSAIQESFLPTPTYHSDGGEGIFCTNHDRAVDASISVAAYNIFRQIEREATLLFTLGADKHGSLTNFFNQRIQQELQQFPQEQKYDASRVLHGLTGTIRPRWGEDPSCINPDNVSNHINIPRGCGRVPLGFVGFLASLLRDLPDCSLKYRKPVGNIRWGAVQSRTKGPRAVVQCCDGDEFRADYVIVTVSLGVLKQHADKLFCPALPTEKVEAIKALGYGQVNKVFLDYARPFWVWHEGSINFAWSADELGKRSDWTKGFSSVEEVEGSNHVLCAYVSGPEACAMEKASDEEIAEGITRVLREATGDASLPYPTAVLRSEWVTDPYFCGAYSYMSSNSTAGHQNDLSTPLPGPCEPEPPILLFAGEATCVGHHSTVHGARLSGIREAERIIQLTKKLGGSPRKN